MELSGLIQPADGIGSVGRFALPMTPPCPVLRESRDVGLVHVGEELIHHVRDSFRLIPAHLKPQSLELVARDPMLTKTEHKNIRQALLDRFGDALSLVDIA